MGKIPFVDDSLMRCKIPSKDCEGKTESVYQLLTVLASSVDLTVRLQVVAADFRKTVTWFLG